MDGSCRIQTNLFRISNEDGTPIDFKRMLSWMMPRYVVLIGRCRMIPNNRVFEGKKCVPNHQLMVSARDGLSQTDLGTFCRSLPKHVLPYGGTNCLYCPYGVRTNSLSCLSATE